MKEFVCICCPLGCALKVDDSNKDDIKVEGFTCPRGKKYAIDEVTAPMRVVTSIVRVDNGEINTVSVKTAEPIPKDKIFKSLELLKPLHIQAPVKIGQVVYENVLGTGVNFVATKNVNQK